jgi:branched-chain amino acid transport system permease protein
LFVYGAVLTFFVLMEPTGLNGRWVRLRRWLAQYPLVATTGHHRNKTYMRSERNR